VHGRRHRQERWLHARISEDLEEALKREARRRRTPVSLLVRNVLEGALDLVEDLVGDGLEAARRARRPATDDVYGWQEIVLNRPAACTACAAALAAGAAAHRGLRDAPGPPVFLCRRCLDRLRQQPDRPKEGSS
jgi:uncharacterized protein with von Willebrand factor type A (vWA) domain